jgi:DNA-directed RNA polymerase alpha subunit
MRVKHLNNNDMNNLQSLSNQIKRVQSEYNKKLKELNRQLEEAIRQEKMIALNQININPKDSITSLDLSVRAYNILKGMGINTIGSLLKLTKTKLMAQPNCGAMTYREIAYRVFEDQLGLELPLK